MSCFLISICFFVHSSCAHSWSVNIWLSRFLSWWLSFGRSEREREKDLMRVSISKFSLLFVRCALLLSDHGWFVVRGGIHSPLALAWKWEKNWGSSSPGNLFLIWDLLAIGDCWRRYFFGRQYEVKVKFSRNETGRKENELEERERLR